MGIAPPCAISIASLSSPNSETYCFYRHPWQIIPHYLNVQRKTVRSQCGFENRTSLYDFQREFLQSLTALQKRRLRTAFPASLPERIKGLFLGESTGRRPVQGKVRRVFDRKLGIKSIHGRMLFIGFLGRSPKRYLEDGRGFRGRKKLLVAKVSSFP